MDQHHLTALRRSLRRVPSRRDIVRGLVAGLGLGFLRLPDGVAAKKQKKRSKKKKKDKKQQQPQPVFNAYGCLEVGQPCRGDSSLCCSGICEGTAPTKQGQPDSSRCVAHGMGTCNQASLGLCLESDPGVIFCNNDPKCYCFRTTAGSTFCHDMGDIGIDICAACRTDADCAAQGYPPGSACAPVGAGNCAALGLCPGGMACLVPCGALPREPE